MAFSDSSSVLDKFQSAIKSLGNGRNTVSRVLLRKRNSLSSVADSVSWAKKLRELAVAHK